MTREEILKTFETLLLELEYAIADVDYGRTQSTSSAELVELAKLRSKIVAARSLVDLGIEVVANLPNWHALAATQSFPS